MSDALEMTPIELVKLIAASENVVLDDDEADYVLWNETGWPCFWPKRQAASPAAALRVQVRGWCRKFALPEPEGKQR